MAKAGTTQVNSYDAQLAEMARVSAKKIAATSSSRKFISMQGALKVDSVVHNDGLPVIVLDDVLTNTYYTKGYNPSKPTGPDCWAIARVNDEGEVEGVDTHDGRTEMAPHRDVKARVCDSCAQCPMNQFGTGKDNMGQPTRGKACQNTKRVALLPVGQYVSGKPELLKKAEDIQATEVHYLKVPVKSVKLFDAFVSVVANVMSRPPFGVVARMQRVPSGANFEIAWETITKCADAWMPAIFQKVEEAKAAITFAFSATEDDDPKTATAAPTARKASGAAKKSKM